MAAQAQIQFRVVRPVDYLFASRSADAAIEALGESALASALAGRAIDDALTAGRAEVAERIRREIQAGADAQGLGISVRAVRLVRVAPPALVAPAFADVARARSDRRQAVTRAEEYHDRALADARGLARETADRAAARHELLVQTARGEADRFARLAAEVAQEPLRGPATPLPRGGRRAPAEVLAQGRRRAGAGCRPERHRGEVSRRGPFVGHPSAV